MNPSLVFAYPGDLALKTGGYGYDRRVIDGLRECGWQVRLLPLGDGFPVPTADTLDRAEAALSTLPDGTLVMIDGLAFGVLDAWARDHAERLRIIALVHHPLALETGLSDEEQQRFRQSEQMALAAARHVIVTSPMTALELASNYGVASSRITVALPGIDKSDARRVVNAAPQILSVGTLTRRKGHDVLLRALKSVEDLDWQAVIIGSKSLDPLTSEALARQVEALGLEARVQLLGEVDDPQVHFASADMFALASRYEGYGMVFAEALSHGLPIVACHAGAVPDVVPADAGILVPVDDAPAFGEALRRLLQSPQERETRSAAALQAGSLLPTWADTAAIISNTLDGIS
ncbi:MAG: glycosyltransferase family 4 protein [Alphaproteobacteria bacterium]|nr:glycosyltransferase family 4 protein [Alphaproteobacteria bacterium]MBU0834523.1 glycosyltransferase family 4 protein [Alphaproteobacteria bacterium]MBU1763216.1 glycosyltransferase family 4 protein [Alphaproteobacteria bacterium]